MMKGVCSLQPLQLSAYLNFLRGLPKIRSTLCSMAMFRVATLFSVVLLGVLVKNVAGVRGLPQPEAMVETEVTWWGEDPCEKYGAKRGEEYKDWCYCPQDRPMQTKECGRSLSNFPASPRPSPGCRCVTEAELEELMRLPVAASALKFCEAVVKLGHRAIHGAAQHAKLASMINPMKSALKKTSPEICQHALVGTINQTEAEEAPWAENASNLSHKGNAEDEDEKYGRMRVVKESATTSGEKKLWKHALARVCKDECEDLLDMMKKETWELTEDVTLRSIPFAQTCAEHVVQQVEGEILGCCGRSCGFNGHTCLLWPFFSAKEKVDWEVECCSEMSVLKNSSRERMCNSILSSRLAKESSKYDREEQNGTDVGKVLIGQNSSLVWTRKGAQKARDGIKLRLPKNSTKKTWRFINKLLHPFGKSVFIKEAGAVAETKVSMDFLLKHPNVGEDFLRRGYFREEPLSKMLDESTSLMEVSSVDGTCDFGKFKKQCPPEWMATYTARCKEAWMVAGEHEEFSNLKEEVNHHVVFGKCYVQKYIDVASPEDCKNIATNSLNQEVLLHYFEYNKENSKKPIKCFALSKGSKEQCEGEPGWWTKIPRKSVEDVIKKEEIKDYKDLVYVKLKTD